MKRTILYETSDLLTNILFSDIIAPKFELDREVYAFDRASIKGKIVRSLFIVAGSEVGSLVGRALGNAIDQHNGNENNLEKAIAGTFEFWGAFIGAQIGCPYGTKLGQRLFPPKLYPYEVNKKLSQ